MNRIRFSAQKQDESPRIVLTADETMMSKYRWGIFVGFSTCMPRGIIPDWFFFSVWSPPGPTESNRAVYADAGLRIMEACLVNVFGEAEVAVVHPHDLEAVVGERTEIIGMGGHDYLGINPPTSEFVEMVNTGPPYNRVKFFELMKKPVMREKIVVAGGKAAWQLADEINGLPSETTDDVIKSIELVADLKGTRSLLVPMNFVSMRGSALDNKETFTMKKMTPSR